MRRVLGTLLVAGALAAMPLTAMPLTASWAQAPVEAEAIPLPATFDYGHRWTINYPDGWHTDTTGFPVLASTTVGVTTMVRGAALPEGSIAMGIIPPDGYSILGLENARTVHGAIEGVGGVFGIVNDIQPLPGLEETAAWAPLIGRTRSVVDTYVVAAMRGEDVFAFIVVVEDFGYAAPLLKAMIESITYPSP